jgi:hypothetical protein
VKSVVGGRHALRQLLRPPLRRILLLEKRDLRDGSPLCAWRHCTFLVALFLTWLCHTGHRGRSGGRPWRPASVAAGRALFVCQGGVIMIADLRIRRRVGRCGSWLLLADFWGSVVSSRA